MSTCIVGTRDTPLERGRTHQHVAKPMTYYLCVNRSRSRDTELHVLLLGTCGSRLIAHQQTKHTLPSIQTHAHQHQQWISSTPSTLGSYKYHTSIPTNVRPLNPKQASKGFLGPRYPLQCPINGGLRRLRERFG
jgi:hypothetical protein